MGQMENDLRLMISASDLPGGCSTVLSGRDSLGPPTVSTVLALVHVTRWAVQLCSRAQRLVTVHEGGRHEALRAVNVWLWLLLEEPVWRNYESIIHGYKLENGATTTATVYFVPYA